MKTLLVIVLISSTFSFNDPVWTLDCSEMQILYDEGEVDSIELKDYLDANDLSGIYRLEHDSISYELRFESNVAAIGAQQIQVLAFGTNEKKSEALFRARMIVGAGKMQFAQEVGRWTFLCECEINKN